MAGQRLHKHTSSHAGRRQQCTLLQLPFLLLLTVPGEACLDLQAQPYSAAVVHVGSRLSQLWCSARITLASGA